MEGRKDGRRKGERKFPGRTEGATALEYASRSDENSNYEKRIDELEKILYKKPRDIADGKVSQHHQAEKF